MDSSNFRLFGSFSDWTLDVFRSPVLWVPLVAFTTVGMGLAVWTMPPEWGLPAKLVSGAVFGVFSYLFPYVNRVLDEDWVGRRD